MQDNRSNTPKSDTPRPMPDFEPTVPEFLHRISTDYGDTDALVDNGRAISYRELERLTAEVALQLLTAGVSKGTRVGLLFPSDSQFAVNFLAATRIGALVVPISTFSTSAELSWVLRHADINVLLTQDAYLKHNYIACIEQAIPDIAGADRDTLFLASHPYLRQIIVYGEQSACWAKGSRDLAWNAQQIPHLDRAVLTAIENEVRPSDQLVLIYTSGSTSRPKSVMHSHGSIIRHLHVTRHMFSRGPGDRYASSQPWFWIGGLIAALLGCLLSGCALHCARSSGARSSDIAARLRQVREEKINFMPAWMHEAAVLLEHPEFKNHDYSFVKYGLGRATDSQGNPMDPSRMVNALGMTETAGVHSWEALQDPLPEHRKGSSGRTREGIERKIVDPESGEALPFGEEGEICVRGYSLMQGYYKLEREDCFDKDGFFHTGDFGYICEDGHLYFTGRRDEVVKVSGVNVSTVEVEQQLMAEDDVLHAYVIAIGEGAAKILVAAVVPAAQATPDENRLKRRLRQHLSSYKVPKRIVFFEEREIPLSAAAKVMKGKLREQIEAGMDDGGQ